MKSNLTRCLSIVFVFAVLFGVAVFANGYYDVNTYGGYPFFPATTIHYCEPTTEVTKIECNCNCQAATPCQCQSVSPCEIIINNNIDCDCDCECEENCGWFTKLMDCIKDFFAKIFNIFTMSLDFNVSGKVNVNI